MLKASISGLTFSGSTRNRAVLACFLFLLEVTLISLHYDAATLQQSPFKLLSLLVYSNEFMQILLCIAGTIALLLLSRTIATSNTAKINTYYVNWQPQLVLHIILLFIFVLLCESIFNKLIEHSLPANILFVMWCFSGAGLVITLLLFAIPYSAWKSIVIVEKPLLLLGLSIGLLAWVVSRLAILAWEPLSDFVFLLVAWVLKLSYSNVFIDSEMNIIGTYAFKVEISPECSGYEGIGMMLVFISLYLYMFKNQLRFPQVFLLYPVGVCVIWLLNVFRIIILIAIGSSFSPQLALGGFHSNAGWITFILTSLGLVLSAQNNSFFNSDSQATVQSRYRQGFWNLEPVALLSPFVSLLAVIILSKLVNNGFDWLYPLRIIVPGVLLWKFRLIFVQWRFTLKLSAVWIGILIFLIWVCFVPVSALKNQQFAEMLFSKPPIISYLWLFSRCLGMTIIIPIVEELAFRGYLASKLTDKNFTHADPLNFTWSSFILTSLAFGAFHQQWLVASFAGIGFYLARLHSQSLYAAIVSHIITNLLLTIYIIYTQNWSLWS